MVRLSNDARQQLDQLILKEVCNCGERRVKTHVILTRLMQRQALLEAHIRDQMWSLIERQCLTLEPDRSVTITDKGRAMINNRDLDVQQQAEQTALIASMKPVGLMVRACYEGLKESGFTDAQSLTTATDIVAKIISSMINPNGGNNNAG